MILSNKELKELCTKMLYKESINRPNLINDLFSASQNNSIIALSHRSSDSDCMITTFQLIDRWFKSSFKGNLFLLDLNDRYDDVESKLKELEELTFDDKVTNVLFVNGCQYIKATRLWLKKILNLTRKHSNLKVYLIFNEIGFLYNKYFTKHNILSFELPAMMFSEYLYHNHKLTKINADEYGQYITNRIENLTDYNGNLSEYLTNKVYTYLHHDAYDLHKKKFNMHAALSLLQFLAFTDIPVLDLKSTAFKLKMELSDLEQLIEILEATRIIKTLDLVDRDLKKRNLMLKYFVFFDPIYYFAFRDAVINSSLSSRFWVSMLVNAMPEINKFQVVEDHYSNLNEQVGIYLPDKKTFLQIGQGEKPIGPLMNYLRKSELVTRPYYLNFQQLINFIVNWQLKSWKKVKNKSR